MTARFELMCPKNRRALPDSREMKAPNNCNTLNVTECYQCSAAAALLKYSWTTPPLPN